MLDTLGGAFNLLLVIIGFGAVIFIHELGHFLAAKWAGVRVHQFAVGFGQAACSYRRGLGFRRGSSEKEYEKLIADEQLGLASRDPATVSPTEYRLNWIPFGGYVKMLGQEDIDPAATSDAPDSYTQKPVWKRMVIISAGVVMNTILAAVLFVVVYMVGRVQISPRIGAVAPGSPAAAAKLVSGDPGATPAHLAPGDLITQINDDRPKSFNDVSLEVVMASPHAPLPITVKRAGAPGPLVFQATPRLSDVTGMLAIGLAPAVSGTVIAPPKHDAAQDALVRTALAQVGLKGVAPGSTLTRVNGAPAAGLWTLTRALQTSDGAPVSVVFKTPAGAPTSVEVSPRPEFEIARVRIPGSDDFATQAHLLGLAPAVRVAAVEPRAEKAGLRVGDLIAQIGPIAWPNVAQTIGEIRSHRGSSVAVTVQRDGKLLDLTPTTDSKGRVGFGVGLALEHHALVTRPPTPAAPKTSDQDSAGTHDETPGNTPAALGPLPAARLDLIPGSVILRVDDRPVTSFFDLRAALRAVTEDAHKAGAGASVTLSVRLPIASAAKQPPEKVAWSLTSDEVSRLHALGWLSPIDPALFELEQAEIQTSNPVRAVVWGVQDTRRMMVKTYLTFLRLFQGTVKVNQLKGPVGIAHLGAQIAEHGLIDLLFFLGLISVNLAVINFLPIPVADGGHFVMLLIELLTGKPVSPAIQNIATMAGFVLIVGVFLLVTFNDISALFGS